MKLEKYYFKKLNVSLYEGVAPSKMSVVLAPMEGVKDKVFGVLVPKGGLSSESDIGGTKIPLGTAHLLEHRLFDTAHGNASEKFSALGVNSNAFTTASSTFYFFSTTGEYKDALDILFSMFSSFYQTNEKIDKEKPIILEEFASDRDSPLYVMGRALSENLYFSSPIREDFIGTEKTLAAIHLSTVKRFYEQFYSAESLTFFGAGDFDPDEVSDYLEKVKLPVFPKLPVKPYDYKENYSSVRVPFQRMPSPDGMTHLGVGIKFPTRKELYEKFGDDLFAIYEVLDEIVFSKVTLPISEMRKRGLIIFSEGAYLEEAGEDAYLTAMFETNSPDRLKEELDKYLSSVSQEYKALSSPLLPILHSYMGACATTAAVPFEMTMALTDSFLNHFAWPALVSRAVSFGKKDIVKFLKEFESFPRSYVILDGKNVL